MIHLVLRGSDGVRRRISWRAPTLVIGSGPDADLRVRDDALLSRHALIAIDGDVLKLERLHASGTVWVNRRSAEVHRPLLPLDRVRVGATRLRACLTGQGAALDIPDAVASITVEEVCPRPASSIRDAHDLPGEPIDVHAWRATRQELHERLLDRLDLRRRDVADMSDDRLRREAETLLQSILGSGAVSIPAGADLAQLKRLVLDEAIGLGPLEPLLADETVSEVMVNRHDEIFVERRGRIERTSAAFTGERALLGIIERIVTPIGRRIDESSPMVDARLPDGSRINAVIPPLSLRGPALTIRRFGRRQMVGSDLVAAGSLSPAMLDFLEVCVRQRRNMLVSGGTGSGKTTLLNVLSRCIPSGERILTIEDAAELRIEHANRVALEARPANAEGRGAVTIRDLVRNSLRMRPDRIIVGECRGGEALDMLQAMNTGHDGSLTTVHANSPRDALARLEVMALMAGMDLPAAAIREQIASAVHIVVQQTRFSCGTRRVTRVTEITGMESGRIQLQDLFVFRPSGIDATGRVRGAFAPCDTVPSFYEELRAVGHTPDLAPFQSDAEGGVT